MTNAVFILIRTLHFGSAMMLFTLPFFILVILRPFLSRQPVDGYPVFCQKLTTWLWASLALAAVSRMLWFWFVAAQTGAQSPWSILAPSAMSAVLWQTSFGRLWLIRAAVGIIFGVALYYATRRNTLLSSGQAPLKWLVISIGACLLITLAWAGHAIIGLDRQILHLLADTPHLLIGAIWPMGLIPMAYYLWYINQQGQQLTADCEVETLQRFSQTSLVAVLILLVTGSINAWLMIGSWQDLVTTNSGRLLLGKVSVVAIMIAMGAFNRFHLMP